MSALPNFAYFASIDKDVALKELEARLNGLRSDEAEERLKKVGPNLIVSKRTTWLHILVRQFKSPFVFMLFAAGSISFLLGERIDALFITVFIALDIFLGFLQEFRSEQALKLLNKLISAKACVLRDGIETSIDSTSLVPGDVILLKPGDIIPADIRLLETEDLIINESILTGESTNVFKSPVSIEESIHDEYKALNIGFKGTTVVSGEGRGVIFATGKNTDLGQIAKLSTQTKRISTFEKDISKFASFILRLVVITLTAVFVGNLLIKPGGVDFIDLALFSIALAVSVIPEALPVVTTFSLSQGSIRMAKKKVVVKRLSAIEDLGSVEILCTDKTGTITQNKLSLVDKYFFKGRDALKFASLASNPLNHDSFDNAILHETSGYLKSYKLINELPFDPQRRRNTVLVKSRNQLTLISRGALENILRLCPTLNTKSRNEIKKWAIEQGESGNRVLAIAYKNIKSTPENLLKAEKNMHFAGLVSFEDPLKHSTISAVKKASLLGVQLKIITGDSLEVARSVGKQIGLINEDSQAVSIEDFEKLPVLKQHQMISQIHVFARVSPEQKYNLIKHFEEQFEVGFLGEGINDAPGLKIANVGLVVKSAADIAREASDIVLLENDLDVIIEGIKEGRKIFANNSKYITATLASNFGNFYAVAIVSLFINYLPMLPLQILLVNLLSDFPMISIATDNVDETTIKRPQHYSMKSFLTKAMILGIVSTVFDFIFFATLSQISPQTLQTGWFMGSIITELIFLFSIRSDLAFFKAKMPTPAILLLTTTAILITIGIPYTAFGQEVFQFIPLSSSILLTVLGICGVYFVTTETVKLLYIKASKRNF